MRAKGASGLGPNLATCWGGYWLAWGLRSPNGTFKPIYTASSRPHRSLSAGRINKLAALFVHYLTALDQGDKLTFSILFKAVSRKTNGFSVSLATEISLSYALTNI
jgi:hypothetical protein